MAEKDKLCPECGALLRRDDTRCVLCRHDFPDAVVGAERRSNRAKIIILAVLCAILIFIAWPSSTQDVPLVLVKRQGDPQPTAGDRPALTPTDISELQGGGGCEAGEVFVVNGGQAIWSDTRIVLNNTWEYQPGSVVPGKQPYMAQLFTDSRGVRLNLAVVTCKTIDIHATVNGHRAHWNGVYR